MKKLYTLITAFILITNAYSQTHSNMFTDWSTPKGMQYLFVQSKTIIDVRGNVYVAGATVNGDKVKSDKLIIVK